MVMPGSSFAPTPLGHEDNLEVSYMRAFGDGLRNFEPWPSDENDSRAGTPSPNYHTNGRMFQLSTDLTCIAAVHSGS
ncbi:hypothetical protein TNCV_4185251 [Trichonephila clavipes]|nr:hypothetical protein TNCV_4185251 [Trichonephila clavipes]